MSAAFLVWVVRSITEFQKEGRARVWGKTEAELDFRLDGFGGLRLSWRSPTVGSGVLRSGTGEAVELQERGLEVKGVRVTRETLGARAHGRRWGS